MIATMEELAKKTKAILCLGCGKCTGYCPLAELGDGLSPRRLVSQALEGMDELNRELLDKCLTCGACEERCPEGVQFIEFIRGVRSKLPPPERADCPHHQVLAEATKMMAEGKTPGDRLGWLTPGLEIAEKGEVFLFVGCAPLFDPLYADIGVRTVEIARSAVRLLNRLGIQPVVSGDEVCCGHDLLWGGDEESFMKLAERNAKTIADSGAKLVLTPCAECARTLSIDCPERLPGFSVKVQHIASFLAEKKADLGLGNGAGEGDRGDLLVTFHDPCRLGRHMNEYDTPRELLDALPGVRRVEMEAHGRDAHCCGTSGFMHCNADSRLMQTKRMNEARETGARALITACPKFMIHFNCARSEDRRRAKLDGTSPNPVTIVTEDLTVLLSSVLDVLDGDRTGKEALSMREGEG